MVAVRLMLCVNNVDSVSCTPLLIIARCGRMLAQLAKNAGLSSIIIDCFADTDTQRLGLKCIKVKSLALVHLIPALSRVNQQHAVTFATYGSGFETHVDSLTYLHKNFTVLGNTSAVFTAIQNKVHFFTSLHLLHIPYPQFSLQAPIASLPHLLSSPTKDWLLKPMQGEGGVGIKKYHPKKYHQALPATDSRLYYWQQYMDGTAMSVVFATDGNQLIIHGFHKQRVVTVADNAFIFSGVISQPDIAVKIVDTVSLWIKKIALAFVLKGINCLDFIVCGRDCYVLEVNARPSASMQLYAPNLLLEHLKCFLKGSLSPPIKPKCYQAYEIIFATSKTLIRPQILWPEWVMDIPQAGTLIDAGMPICSIIASDKNELGVEADLLARRQIINTLLR